MWYSARERSKTRGIPFEIEVADIQIPLVCPLLGVPLQRGSWKHHDFSPSLDRIDPSKGYVKGNVWVISYRANQIKNNATLGELELLVANLKRVWSA